MTIKLNFFENGADEAAITTGNSAGPDAFDATTNCTFDTAHAAHGSVSSRCNPAGTSTSGLTWFTSGATWHGRIALYMGGAPPANMQLVQVIGAGVSLYFRIMTGRTVQISSTAVGNLGTSTTVLALNQWNGIEFKVIQGTTSANLGQCKIYTDQYFESVVETINASSTTVASWDRIRIGASFSAGQTYDLWIDDLGLSDTDYLGNHGLVIPRRPIVSSAAVMRAANW